MIIVNLSISIIIIVTTETAAIQIDLRSIILLLCLPPIMYLGSLVSIFPLLSLPLSPSVTLLLLHRLLRLLRFNFLYGFEFKKIN